MKYLIICLLLITNIAQASNGSQQIAAAAIAGTSVAGVVTGTQYAIYYGLMNHELEGWADKSTGTTTVLESQCNLQAEFHLVGDNRRNFVMVGLSNKNPVPAVIQGREIEFVFDGEYSRYPGWTFQQSDSELKPGWWQLSYVPFPTKEEFGHSKTIEVKIPVKVANQESCIISAKFTKKKKIYKEETSYSILEFSFEGGPSISQDGPIKFLGKPGGLFGLSMTAYPHPNHGVGFVILGEQNFKDSKNQKIRSEFEKGAKYSANATFIGLNYAYRHFLSPRTNFTYEPAIGYQTVFDGHDKNDKDKSNEEKSSAFAFEHKLMFNWTFARIPLPTMKDMDFSIGAGIVHIYVPDDEINGQRLNGNRYGGLFRFGMGF